MGPSRGRPTVGRAGVSLRRFGALLIAGRTKRSRAGCPRRRFRRPRAADPRRRARRRRGRSGRYAGSMGATGSTGTPITTVARPVDAPDPATTTAVAANTHRSRQRRTENVRTPLCLLCSAMHSNQLSVDERRLCSGWESPERKCPVAEQSPLTQALLGLFSSVSQIQRGRSANAG